MKTLLLITLLPMLLITCTKEKGGQPNNSQLKPISLTSDQKALVQSNNQFAFNLYRSTASVKPQNNLFISPFSVSMALSMTLNGAAGNTKTQMASTLGFPGFQAGVINDYNKLLSNQLQTIDPLVTFNVANSIWYRNTFPVLPAFLSTNRYSYNAEVAALDFNSPSAVTTINNWVSAKTNQAIPSILSVIDPADVMYLINAIYFKGSWRSRFDASLTSNLEFNKEDQTKVTCPMMTQKATFPYYANDTLTAMELPYGQGNFVMTILVPQQGQTTATLTNAFTAANWKRWTGNLHPVEVQLSLPRFKMKWESTLNGTLSAMGMSDAFNSQLADFTGINANGGLYISLVFHKTMIDVNEEGTVAAAVTLVGITTTSVMMPAVLNVNKPFLFVISEKSTGAILFTGRMMDPTKSE